VEVVVETLFLPHLELLDLAVAVLNLMGLVDHQLPDKEILADLEVKIMIAGEVAVVLLNPAILMVLVKVVMEFVFHLLSTIQCLLLVLLGLLEDFMFLVEVVAAQLHLLLLLVDMVEAVLVVLMESKILVPEGVPKMIQPSEDQAVPESSSSHTLHKYSKNLQCQKPVR
jgi:hypothetical protein